MTTDRELLELAAKAAGLKHVDYTGVDYDGKLGIVLVDAIGRHCETFDPMNDDGDALRLAVTLGIGTRHHQGWSEVFHPLAGLHEFKHGGCVLAATRRAIVRAAAEIGRAMK